MPTGCRVLGHGVVAELLQLRLRQGLGHARRQEIEKGREAECAAPELAAGCGPADDFLGVFAAESLEPNEQAELDPERQLIR